MSRPEPIPNLTIVADEGPEIIAKAIEDVANAAKKLLNSRLSRRAIVLLIKDQVGGGIGMGDIDLVLEAAAGLRKYIVKGPKDAKGMGGN